MALNEFHLNKLPIDDIQFKNFVKQVHDDFPDLQKNDMPALRWFTFVLMIAIFVAIISLYTFRVVGESDLSWIGGFLANIATELIGITLVVAAFDSLRDAKLGIMQEKECERYVKLLYLIKGVEEKMTCVETGLQASNKLKSQQDLSLSADLAIIKKDLERLTTQKHHHRKYLNRRAERRFNNGQK